VIVSGHLGPPFVDNLELEFLHGLLEAVQGLGLYVSQLLVGSVVSGQDEGPASEVVGEVLYTPYGSLHLEETGGVISFGAENLAAGISLDTVFSTRINLGEDGSHASWFIFVAEAGVGDKAEGAVLAGCPTTGVEHKQVWSSQNA
jgi:hypothetical protein